MSSQLTVINPSVYAADSNIEFNIQFVEISLVTIDPTRPNSAGDTFPISEDNKVTIIVFICNKNKTFFDKNSSSLPIFGARYGLPR